MKKDYYEILEVSPNASPEVIEKAYKTLTRKYHPDVQSKDKIDSAESHFKEIVKAYEILSDPERKQEYDEYNKLETELNSLKNGSEGSKKEDSTNKKENIISSQVKTSAQSIYNTVRNHSKKSKDERSKDIKALVIALCFMLIISIIFWKVPFFRNILFP